MSFLQKIRSAFGFESKVEDNPIEILDNLILEESIARQALNKAIVEFDEIEKDFSLRLQACDVLIEKGSSEGEFSKRVVEQKFDRISENHIVNIKDLTAQLNGVSVRKENFESELLAKAIESVSIMSNVNQAMIHDTISEWQETGLYKGEEVESHLKVILYAIGDVQLNDLEKGKAAQIGEQRVWAGQKMIKTGHGWIPVIENKKEKKHSTQELVAHAENTSTTQLKKIASDESKDPHVRDAAKREIERRNEPKDAEKRKWAREDQVRSEDKADAKKEKREEAKVKEKEREAAAAQHSDKSRDPVKRKKKKKLNVDYRPSEDLSREHSKIEKSFGKYLNTKYKEAKIRYEAKFGNVLNTDNARELSDDYEKNRQELSSAVHEPASAFVKKMYEEMLASDVPEGKRNVVLFTAGGTGAGKTTGIQGTMKKDLDRAHIVFDTNMNGYDSSVKKIQQALDAGKKVKIAYTFRDPVDAFENGAIPRSMRIGRTVPIADHVNTHVGSMDSIIRLAERYKDNPNVKISVIDNSRGQGNARLADIAFVKKKNKSYNATELREQLHGINKSLYEQGKITESHYRGFKGNE